MEAFSLLKYWIGGGGGGATSNMRLSSSCSSSSSCTTTTITTTLPRETTDESDDEGPFFDLEFTLPVEEEDGFEEDEGSDDDDDDRDSAFSSSASGGGPPSATAADHPDLPSSPSENLFFKGGELLSLEPSPSAPSGHACDANSKRQFPVSLLRSATKFRVFLLGFKKAKPSSSSSSSSTEAAAASAKQQHSRFFTVKFKVEEVPIVSLFRRENSWRSCSCKRHSEEDGMSASEEMKRLLKDVMHKYMKMLKPVGVNGSKDGGERHGFLSLGLGGKQSNSRSMRRNRKKNSVINSSSFPVEEEEGVKKLQQQQRQGSLREVCRHLSKSRSVPSSTAVAPAAASPSPLQSQSQRRDDSLLQQQDGIQSAIAHCKRSLNAPLESEAVAVC